MIIFLAVLRASHILDRCSNPLRHGFSTLCYGYFGDRVSLFVHAASGPQSSCFTLLVLAGMTGAHHNTQLFSIEMRSRELFLLGLA
jgi:hypothetical protein